MKGSFFAGDGCKGAYWRQRQCGMANLYLILIGAGLVLVCLASLCTWLYCKCRARNKKKTKALLDNYDEWVSSLSHAHGTPKTDAQRSAMAAKYGIKDKESQGTPLIGTA